MTDKTKEAKDLLLGGAQECHYCRHRKEEYHDNCKMDGPFYSYYSDYCDAEQDLKHDGHCGFLWLGRKE